jgi:hypothetical protein
MQAHGEFQLDLLSEGDNTENEATAFVKFNQPLHVSWLLLPEHEQSDQPPDPAVTGKARVHVEISPGIQWECQFACGNQHPAARLINTNREGIEASIKRMLAFEFAHAFLHYEGDPNYGLLHWAIAGNFKNSVTLIERDENGIAEETQPQFNHDSVRNFVEALKNGSLQQCIHDEWCTVENLENISVGYLIRANHFRIAPN